MEKIILFCLELKESLSVVVESAFIGKVLLQERMRVFDL